MAQPLLQEAREGLMWATALRKGAPFAGYEDFDDCTEQNSGKRDPDAYCGEIKHKVEGSAREAASGLPQIQQHVDPNNQPDPEGDELPAGVAFPIGDNSPQSTFGQQWSTGPQGPQPRTGGVRREALDMSGQRAAQMGHADAMAGETPSHKDGFGASKQRHRRYLEGWNQTAGLIHGLVGRAPMTKAEYGQQTGRADLHSHYLAAYAQGRSLHGQSNSLYRADPEGQTTASLRATADAWTHPHQTTDDVYAPYNSAETSPEPWSQNGSPQSQDFQAGVSAGQADRQAGERPLFADNSSGVSPYVKGYAQGYGAPQAPQGPQDVPRSMGGDSGQAVNSEEARRSFQVARASRRTASAQDAWQDARDNLEARHQVDGGHAISGAPGDEKLEGEGTGGRSSATWKTSSLRRVSAAFAPDSLMSDPEFRRAYLFASKWHKGQRLVSVGSARFEAGLYAGITDRPEVQGDWITAHWLKSADHPALGRRITLHHSFTRKCGSRNVYLSRTAGTSTDLITDGPGTSPDPSGATPLNGPGTTPPMAGASDPAKAGGAPPYQGAPPLPGGPVVDNDIMGRPQEAPQPSGTFVQTYSGMHPENALLAPAAPNMADQPGYSNAQAYEGDPRRQERLAAFRRTVQANVARMGALG